MKRKRHSTISLVALTLVTLVINHAQTQETPRGLMSAPLDLLSESLASSTSLINQLLMKRRGEVSSGPQASALLAKEARRLPNDPVRQSFRRRRRKTTQAPSTEGPPQATSSSNRETLVFACPEPEGCPQPVSGQKYEPVRVTRPNANQARPAATPTRNVLETIFRQEVEGGERKRPVMRIRKKQRKPTQSHQQAEVETELPVEAVEMVSEMIKEAGPVITQQEIEIISDVSQEVGAKVNEKQVKILSLLVDSMGPELDSSELKTMSEVANTIEENDNLAPDSTLKVVAEMVKAKVGQIMTPQELDQIEAVMTTGKQNEEAKESGFTDHAAEMVAQMINNIGPEATDMEVKIVADMIKELDKDVAKETAEVMAAVLKEVMLENEPVSPQLVHNVSAAVSQGELASLTPEDIKMIAEVIKEAPMEEKKPVSPEVIQMVAEIAMEKPGMPDREVVRAVERKTGEEVNMDTVEVVKVVAAAMGEEKVTQLEDADLEILTVMVNEIQDDKVASSSVSSTDNQQSAISEKEANFLSEVVKLFGSRVTPAERAELEVEVKKMNPAMNENEAEVMTELLVKMGPKVSAEEVKEVSELVQDPRSDIRSDNVEAISEMANEIQTELKPADIKTIAKMVTKAGPQLTMREMQMISRMAPQQKSDMKKPSMKDVAMIANIVAEVGPRISNSEATLISMMTKSKNQENEDEEEEIAEIVASMGKVVTASEEKVVKMEVKKMIPSMKENEAEVMTKILVAMGPEVLPEEVKEVAELVLEDSHSLNIDSGNVEEIIEMAKEIETELEPAEVQSMASLIGKAGPHLTMREMQMISRMMAQKSGIKPKLKDVAMMGKIVDEVGQASLSDPEAGLISMMTSTQNKKQQNTEDSSLGEAVVEVISTMGNAITEPEKLVIQETIQNVTGDDLTGTQAEMMAEVIQMAGPDVSAEKVEILAEVVVKANEIDTSEKMKNVTEIIEDKLSELPLQAAEIMTVANVVGHMGMIGSKTMTLSEEMEVVSVSQQLGAEVSRKEVEAVNEIMEVAGESLSMEDAELVEVVSKVLQEEKKAAEIVNLKKGDAEHLADMMSSPGGSLMDAPTVATMLEKMMEEKKAKDKVEVMAQILVEISPNVSPQNVTEVAKLVIVEDKTSDVTMQDVKSMANVARQLNTELSFKEVKAIAEVKADNAVMSFNVMKQAVAEANQASLDAASGEADKAIEMKDVQVVAEMIDMIQADNDDKIELVAIMTMVAKVEIISPESSHRFTTTGITNQEMSSKEVENLVEMVEKVAEMKGETQVQMEKILVQELLQMTSSLKMTKDKAETAVKIMEQLPELDSTKAKMVVETLEESSSSSISVEKVEKVAELAQDLSENVEPIDMVVVSNLVSRMGPNPNHRQVEMVARLAANSDVQVKMEDVVVINDIANELGNEISQPEAELILLMTQDSDSEKVMATKEATEVADALQSMGTFMSSDEIDDLKSLIAEASPKLDSKEVGLMTEVLLKVGPDVDAELVEKVAEVTEKVSDSMSPHLVDMIAGMAGDLEAKLTAQEVDKVVELVQKTGSVMSPRELKMIQRMSKKDIGMDLKPADIQVINEMVKMLGPDIQEEEVEMVALITEEVGNKATDASAEKLVESLQSMEGKARVSLEELEELENQIEKMEPLMTNSKAQVMSQVLIEADPQLINSNDVEELAEIVMQTSDDITPGDVEEMAEIARGGDGQMTEKEVKVVADMTAKFGQSLSNREVHMIARMMRSSGLVVSMNDIVMVSEIVKMMGTNHITKEDSKLVAKLTEMVSSEDKQKKSKTTKKPFTRVSSLPQKPTVSSLPSRPSIVPSNRLKMRVKNKERRKGASRPPPRTYVPTTTTTVSPVAAQGPMIRMPIRNKQNNEDAVEFGLKRPKNTLLPTFEQKPIRENLPDFPIQSLRPTLESLTTSTESERTVEDSTKIRLEEFLMRNRPTPFRTTFPSEDPPEEGDFLDAIEPTSADGDDGQVLNNDVVVKMPGDSFMQISMGKSGFSESLKLPPPPPQAAAADDDQAVPTNQPPQTVSRDTLKSVAENFSFTKNEPQGMLMSFLMKTKPTMKPEMTTSSPTNMIWTEDEPMRQNFFPRRGNGESSSLDNSITGNFIRMKMGDKEPQGVEPSVMPKLEKTKITLDMDGNSFMSMQMGSDVLSERMSSIGIDDTVYEDNYNDIPMLKDTVKRKISVSGGSPSNFAAEEEPWQADIDTPFTVRPTLPIGQATIWPHQTPEATPFTVKPSTLRPVRPTLKPFIHLGKTQDVWQENTTPTPFTVRPTRRGQAFTVRPTKRPVTFNYIHKSPQGAKLAAHDVKLKSPYESSSGFSGDTSYLKNNYHRLQNGFTGIGSLRHPGMHDDRPPYKQPLQKEEETFKASFGDVKFNLPAHGSLPDIPVKTVGETDAILRDLPNVEQLDYESDEVGGGGEGKQYGKSYLKNPYGADFIRLEIDSDRYKHNKTRRIGTIHHIPLKVHGYAETSEFPVSTDTERPVIGGHHHPPKMQSHRPKKQVGGVVKNGNQPSSRHPFKAVKNAMETIPHAIHHLPNLMQSLVSNHASWMDKVWPNEDESTKKSFDAITTSLQKKDIIEQQ